MGCMYKLVILIKSVGPGFNENWPQFLHLAEAMPGLQREATSTVQNTLYGEGGYSLIHELFFDSYTALELGLGSPVGQEAGRLLQTMTGGRMTLLVADHHEDDLRNFHPSGTEEPHDNTPDPI